MKGSHDRRWVARDWCDALVAHGDDQLEHMASDQQARYVVNDEFECRTQHNEWRLTPLKWAIDSGVLLDRIHFLVQRAGARVTNGVLDRAVIAKRWEVADYLHGMGARYIVAASFVERIGQLFYNNVDQEPLLELLLQYPEHWDTVRMYSNGPALIDLAQHRQKMAREAATAVLATQKKRSSLMCRDVSTTIAKMVYDAKTLHCWGMPPIRNRSASDAYSFVLCGVMVGLFFTAVIVNYSGKETPYPVLDRMPECASRFIGPTGPQGLCRDGIAAFTISEGVGIVIPGASIAIGDPWTVPGKCFAFPYNKTKL